MNDVTTNDSGALRSAPTPCAGLVLCVDGAEARILRAVGYTCITAGKMRRLLLKLLRSGNLDEALNVVGRLDYVSTADDPEGWPMWVKVFQGSAAAGEVRRKLSTVTPLQTPLRDPEKVTVMGDRQLWACAGTTIFVAKNTFDLVRVADTYATADCYRPRGRMDEPFRPQPGRVCLVTEDELRLLRLQGDETIVIAFKPEEMPGRAVARWPSSIRALCGEHPGLSFGVAPGLVESRHGWPFMLGLTRGVGFEATAETDIAGDAAIAYCVETNYAPESVKLRVVIWAGGDDVRQLVRYGGLSIFTGLDSRRKVQLRSLGLAKSGAAAGAAIYDLSTNFNTLTKWAITRTFVKPDTSQRERDHRRVRPCKALPQSTRGTYIIQDTSPRRIKVTPAAARKEAALLRQYPVGEAVGATTVHLISLGIGGTYYLNGRAKSEKEGEVTVDAKRSKIRCPRWNPKDAAAMLEELAKDVSVVFAGREPTGEVFAVVKVANGTEDQQREAVSRWSHALGLKFPNAAGCGSWCKKSVAYDAPVVIGSVTQPNWKALSLETACFERYQTAGDYSKPVKIERRATATLSERARAYVDRVPLADEGTRNQNLHGVSWNVGDKFGPDALVQLAPLLLSRSTLPEKEKRTIINRAITRTKRKQST